MEQVHDRVKQLWDMIGYRRRVTALVERLPRGNVAPTAQDLVSALDERVRNP